MTAPIPQLYIISPEIIDDVDEFVAILPDVLKTSGATCFQLRLPPKNQNHTPENRLEIAKTIVPLVQSLGIACIIADDTQLAKSCGADGVHLEMPLKNKNGDENKTITAQDVKNAKSILGDNAIVGASCKNSRDIGLDCADAGADYVSFGTVFKSPHKPNSDATGMDTLNWWVEMVEIPCVAIGGITADNLPLIIESQVDFVGVISGIWQGNAISNAEKFAKVLKSG